MSRRTGLVLALITLAIALAVVPGCGEEEPGVVDPWPEAGAERTVPEPPEPVRWPLTGLEAPSAEAVTRRVISVKIENSSAARPQTNLQLADVVYESVTEGGITRFNAIFHSQLPEVVGPVRSARLSDTYIVPQYHALFAFSGASSSVNSAVSGAGIENLSQDAGVSRPFSRSSARPAPHNLYADVTKVLAEGELRGMSTTQASIGLEFNRSSAASTPTVTFISIPFSQANKVEWTYDTGTGTYLRANNGKTHTDAGTSSQLSAKNVVVMWAQHKVAGTTSGSTTYEIVLAGSGRATVFHDGQRFDGTWEATRDAPPVFKAADGTAIKLAPGNTWFQVVNTSVNIAMQ
ncbi:MAG: DUF3048 domain-containing protein [Coriobacteriia bacterium]|nr:DUF3048 domain-containing protein [Coriobacteriia bacterium]